MKKTIRRLGKTISIALVTFISLWITFAIFASVRSLVTGWTARQNTSHGLPLNLNQPSVEEQTLLSQISPIDGMSLREAWVLHTAVETRWIWSGRRALDQHSSLICRFEIHHPLLLKQSTQAAAKFTSYTPHHRVPKEVRTSCPDWLPEALLPVHSWFTDNLLRNVFVGGDDPSQAFVVFTLSPNGATPNPHFGEYVHKVPLIRSIY